MKFLLKRPSWPDQQDPAAVRKGTGILTLLPSHKYHASMEGVPLDHPLQNVKSLMSPFVSFSLISFGFFSLWAVKVLRIMSYLHCVIN